MSASISKMYTSTPINAYIEKVHTPLKALVSLYVGKMSDTVHTPADAPIVCNAVIPTVTDPRGTEQVRSATKEDAF
jgi:hypothetical protein